MSDFDTRRIGEIAVLEEKIQNLQEQLSTYKSDAEKWKPRVAGEFSIDAESAKISMAFGGKMFSATMTADWLQHIDVTTGTSVVIDTLVESLVKHQLREVVQPEVERMKRSADSLKRVSKW